MARIKRYFFWLLIALGIIFIHFLELAIYVHPAYLEKGGERCLPESIRDAIHDDYVILKWIKRKYTVFCDTDPPIQILGNQDYNWPGRNGKWGPKPIPPPGYYQVSIIKVETKRWNVYLPYVATTLRFYRFHVRVGWRWDDLDDYYTWTISRKIIPYNWELLLWNYNNPMG